MLRLQNIFSGLLIGKNEQNIIIDPKIDTLVKAIKNDFYRGNILDALNTLEEAIKEHTTSKKSIYYLLLLKSSFMLDLFRIDDFKNIMNVLESNFADYCDVEFDELRLTLYSLEKKENDYFELSKKVSVINGTEKEFFEIIYYLNTNQEEKAKLIFESKYHENLTASQLLIGGHIYNRLYIYDDITIFNKSISYYEQYQKKRISLNKITDLSIEMFKTLPQINHFFNTKVSKIEDKSSIITLQNTIINFWDTLSEFDIHYKNSLINRLLHTYIVLEEIDKYKSLAEKHTEILDIPNSIQYHLSFEMPLPTTILGVYERQQDTQIIIAYLDRLLFSGHDKEVITFVDNNNFLLLDNLLIWYKYSLAQIELNQNVDELEETLKTDKYKSVFHLLTFLTMIKKKHQQASEEDVQTLTQLFEESPIYYNTLIQSIKILFSLQFHSEALKLTIKFSTNFSTLNNDVIELCIDNDSLNLSDFEWYIEQISQDNVFTNIQIGNVYASYFHLYKAFEYFYKAWEYSEVKSSSLSKNIFRILLQMKQFNMSINKEALKNIIIELEHQKDFNDLEASLFAVYYFFSEEKYKEGTILFNKSILQHDCNNLPQDIIDLMPNLYYQSISVENKINFSDIAENKMFLHNKKNKISDIYENIQINNLKNLNLETFSYRELYLIEKENPKISSLFHYITNQFITKSKHIQALEIDNSKENPFEELFEMMKVQTEDSQAVLDNYNNGKMVPFKSLATQGYESYPAIIDELLEKEKNKFYSGKNNIIDNSIKKIITFSSIIFLHQQKYLEKILERDDTYIQATVLNWIETKIKELAYKKEYSSAHYHNGKIIMTEIKSKDINNQKSFYEDIYTLILRHKSSHIIDDYENVWPFKNTVSYMNFIGHFDYLAIAYIWKYPFQIISEDRISYDISKQLKFNMEFISNSMSLLQQTLKPEEFINLAYNLHLKNYRYVLNDNHINSFTNILDSLGLPFISNNVKELFTKMSTILYDYGALEFLLKYYNDNYTFVIPMLHKPKRDHLATNIEFIIHLIQKQKQK